MSGPMDISEIHRRCVAIEDAMLAKGLSRPVCDVKIDGRAARHWVHLTWFLSSKDDFDDRRYEFFYAKDNDISAALAKADAFVAAMEGVETARLRQFQKRLADTIDVGREIGVEIEVINPLVEAAKALSKNALMAPA